MLENHRLMTRTRVARAVRDRIAADPLARWLGVQVLALAPGRSRMRLVTEPRMANFHGMVHGGVIFALADAAFAAAANAHGELAVALAMSIQFLDAARPGSVLVAEAREERLGRRAAFYAMTITDESGRTIATCQGVVHRRSREGGS